MFPEERHHLATPTRGSPMSLGPSRKPSRIRAVDGLPCASLLPQQYKRMPQGIMSLLLRLTREYKHTAQQQKGHALAKRRHSARTITAQQGVLQQLARASSQTCDRRKAKEREAIYSCR